MELVKMIKNNDFGRIEVTGTEYQSSEPGTILAQIFDSAGTPANSATVILTLFKSDGTKILDDVSMSYVADSNGIYKYDFTAPAATGVYIADVSSTSPTAYGCDEVHVSDALTHLDADISSRASPSDILEDVTKKVPADLGDVPTDSEFNAKHGSGTWESKTKARF